MLSELNSKLPVINSFSIQTEQQPIVFSKYGKICVVNAFNVKIPKNGFTISFPDGFEPAEASIRTIGLINGQTNVKLVILSNKSIKVDEITADIEWFNFIMTYITK